MECSTIKKNLFAIQENTLSPDDRSEIDLHIESCPECALIVSGFRETMGIINKDRSKEINPFMGTRIIQCIESMRSHHADSKQLVFLRVLKPVAFTFSFLLAVLLGFSLGKTGMKGISDKTADDQYLQSIRSELFISDITDEDKTLFLNP